MAQRSIKSSASDRIHCSRGDPLEIPVDTSDKIRRLLQTSNKKNRWIGRRWFSKSMLLSLTIILSSLSQAQSQQITTNILNGSGQRRLGLLDQPRDQDLDDDSNVILQGAAANDFDGGTGEGDTVTKGGIGSSSSLKSKVKNEWEQKDLKKRYEEGEDRLMIQSLFPRGGPITGTTKVEVRGDGMEDLVDIFPDPKCRFGSNANIVSGNWIKCSKKPPTFYEREHEQPKNFTCILCEDSPPNKEAHIVSFSVSLSGNFNDVYSSLPYRYYNQLQVTNIYPRYGPKDGDTVVQVWGDNFLDLGDDFRCNFGTRSTKAYFVSTTFLWCRAAHSDIVGKAQPFSVSLNRQQNSMQDIEYWYYNDPNVQKLVPDFAPLGGGATITLRGNNFLPFDYINDINNSNDTFCIFGALGKKPAKVVSSTELRCLSPPNTFQPPLVSVMLQLTLNNQNATEGLEFIFFNPPGLSEVTPLRGPVTGGTEVQIYGTKFNHARDPVCIFGGITVTAKFWGPTHLSCISPPFYRPGETTMTIKYRKDRFHAGVKIFMYFEVPTVASIDPTCGPMKGYTQIYVVGSNFIENNGFGKAQCKFNDTYFTNATVVDTNTLWCDSPQLDLGDSDSGDFFYNFSVSADGESFSIPNVTFLYYDDPDIRQIQPPNGPMNENNNVNIIGKSLSHPNMCNMKIRFGQQVYDPMSAAESNVAVMTQPVNVPGSVVVTISGNGQQWSDDVTLHFRDRSNTYEYFQPFLIEDILPNIASAGGHTDIHLTGMLYDQFKNHNGTSKELDFKCRFKDANGNVIGTERNMTRVSDIEYICTTPPSKYSGHTIIEINQNDQNWQDIGRNLTFYNGPKVTEVNPTYGVTKNPKGTILHVKGENFACPDGDCSHIKVRFTNKNGDRIVVSGRFANGEVETIYPEYPSPETLDVDISFNGLDWSGDKVKFSYIDPFVLGVKPRLISPRGTTKLMVEGYGMAHTGDEAKSRVAYKHYPDNKVCSVGGQRAEKVYKVHNENLIEVSTFPQEDLMYETRGVNYDPFTVNIMNPDGEFDPNDIFLYYYAEPDVKKQSAEFAYANEEKVILFDVDFKWGQNHPDVFRDYANFTCRFSSEKNASYVKYTDAFMEMSPIGSMKHGALADQIRCRTPLWDYPGDVVRLDVSINGQDYYGNYPMNMVDSLSTLRISPLCGPIDGGTKVNIYGTGMNSSVPQEASVIVKFGTTHSQQVDKSNIDEITYSDDDYHEELHLSDKLLKIAETNYPDVDDKQQIEKYSGAITPNITEQFSFAPPDVRGQGGVVSVLIGENVNISITDHDKNSSTYKQKVDSYIECAYYDTSDLEFYFYRNPIVTKLEPNSGLTSGGTTVDISGAWFAEYPMYGLFPFCRFGGIIVRGRFISTTRIQCTSPQTGASNAVKIEVSLNAVDWVDTGHDFGYYEKPVLNDIRPRYGNIAGGTEIWLKGEKFSNATNGLKTVMCRFTQMSPHQAGEEDSDGPQQEDDDFNAPVRFMPAYYVDQDTMKCASPSGFGGGDKVWVDLTFNGVDYTDNKFEYSYYAFYGSFPKSAPYDATNQFIQVRGKGFSPDMAILCILDNVEMAPLAVHYNLIKCPMIVDKEKRRRLHDKENRANHGFGENDFGSVPFEIKVEGVKQSFGNFHYYRQCVIDDVTPLIAPNDGKGAIYVIGRGFRDDFENSRLGCRIGNTLAHAQLLDPNTIRCTINNELPLIEEGESLLVTVALNTYSWAASDFSMLPYGITAMYPNMGPIGQSTNILVTGKGFDNDLRENGRCKFGTEDHYIIVEANVLDNEHLICKSPADAFALPEGASEVISVPFSIAFQEDLYFPFTQGGEKYRMYRQPKLTAVTPNEVHVGRLSELYVSASEDASFWQPAPPPTGEQFEQYGIKCKFGRFGSSPGTYINRTTILCLTPNVREAPSDISTETVDLTIAMNGVDYNDDFSDLTVTFIGTGQGMSIWVIIMGTLIFALLIISIIVFLFGLQTLIAAQNTKSDLDQQEGEGRSTRGGGGGGAGDGGGRGGMSSGYGGGVNDRGGAGSRGAGSRGAGADGRGGAGSRGGGSRGGGSRGPGDVGGGPGSGTSQQRDGRSAGGAGGPAQRSDSAAGGAGGRLSRANGGSRNQGGGSRGLGNRATGSRQGQN